ncbi:MAG: hypothetical protein F4147_12315 [Gammaproteobacteria bacterium]|nr:hypothetical protein [Gammaproteobacteria bacterium]
MIKHVNVECSTDQDDVLLTLTLRWPATSFLALARQVQDVLHPVRTVNPSRPPIEHQDQPD